MADRLPPLNALRAFEAAARHLSFTRAAQELHVTAGAVSHQVKTLEEYLGVQLFHRSAQALYLTPAAAACLPELQDGFRTLTNAVSRLTGKMGGLALTVNVAPAFAGRWLIPRLQRFTDAYPEIDLRISAELALVDVRRQDSAPPTDSFSPDHHSDLTIRFGSGEYPGHDADLLCASTVTALCAPQLIDSGQGLHSMKDLAHQTLLHDDTVYFDSAQPDWAYYLKSAGVNGIDVSRGPRFNNAILAISAATDGLGVALSMTTLAESELASRRLVMPFAFRLPARYNYFLVRPLSVPLRAPAALFRDWLLKESAACQALPAL
jgi:LysR family transcriptional regulator, glycine cleavage system transcriptional activator